MTACAVGKLELSGPNEKTRKLLKWAKSELGETIRLSQYQSLSLLAGHTCPGAHDCKSWVDLQTLKLVDGANCIYRCFSASQEVMFKATRAQRQRNTERLRKARTRAGIRKLLLASIDESVRLFRYHISGDFYSLAYLQAVIDVARLRPETRFYAYTKSWHHLIKVGPVSALPSNLRITLSLGSKFTQHHARLRAAGFATARVVFSESEARDRGLAIDQNDSLASYGAGDFALLLHGAQPAGSDASKALVQIKRSKAA